MSDIFSSYSSSEFEQTPEFSLTEKDWERIAPHEIDIPYTDHIGLNCSTLKAFASNPDLFDKLPKKEDSASMSFGTMFHCALLEPKRFEDEYQIFTPPINKATKEPYKTGKAYNDALAAFEANGLKAKTPDDQERIDWMLTSYGTKGFDFFEDGRAELPLSAPVNNTMHKCRIDFLSSKYGIIDIKTTSSPISNPKGDNLSRFKVLDYCYPEQCMFYAEILAWILDVDVLSIPCRIVMFETTIPYRVGVMTLSRETKKKALAMIHDWERLYNDKERTDRDEDSPETFFNKYEWIV